MDSRSCTKIKICITSKEKQKLTSRVVDKVIDNAPSTMAIGFILPSFKPDRSPKSAKGKTRPPPTVLELPGGSSKLKKCLDQ